MRGSGLDPAALEFIDATHTKMLRETEGVDLPDYPDALHGVSRRAGKHPRKPGWRWCSEICEEMGALSVHATTDTAERRKLWHARHHSYEIMVRSHPGYQFFIMDVAVPISAYPELIGYVEAVEEASTARPPT